YQTEFYRQLRDTRGYLRGREFRMFAAIAIEADRSGMEDSLTAFSTIARDLLVGAEVPFIEAASPAGHFFEFFYPWIEGDESVTGHKLKKPVPALSIAMAYQYAPDSSLPIRYRTPSNRNSCPRIVTFGLGTQRLLFAVLDAHRDKLGI